VLGVDAEKVFVFERDPIIPSSNHEKSKYEKQEIVKAR